ncbi:MAG: hypothetical protein QJR06_01830 [Alicyclobacillaceae bacterium]|nr:hypothetical protein [Alicyclobacillaceae bacterium]
MPHRAFKKTYLIAAVVLFGLFLSAMAYGMYGKLAGPKMYDPEFLKLGIADYGAKHMPQGRCAPGSRSGRAGVTNDLRTSKGFRYIVKTPANYDPNRMHPLIVVYAPAGMSAESSEQFVGLTRLATESGFIIAYADSQPLSIPAIIELGTIPQQIAEKWCVDVDRIYFTGHSDGGTVSTALAILKETRGIPAAIAPSAAGFRGEDLAAYECPGSLPVMVMHNRGDRVFPGYGREAADWWATCNHCQSPPGTRAASGSDRVVYSGCKAPTIYYETNGEHSEWPGLNREIIEFFKNAGPRREETEK